MSNLQSFRLPLVDIRFTSVRTCARVYLCKHRAEQGRGMRGTSRGIVLRRPLLRSDTFASLPFLLARDFSRRRGRALRVVADDSDGRPCGLLLYHRRGETMRWRPTTKKKKITARTTDGTGGRTGVRYYENQIVRARHVHVGRTND